jgi:exosortase
MAETPHPQSNGNSDAPREENSHASRKAPPSLLDDLLGLASGILKELAAFGAWCRKEPVAALALAGIAAVLAYFYGAVHPFMYGAQSTAEWAWKAWNPEGDQSYGVMVPVIAVWLFYYHREALKNAAPGEHKLGLALVGAAIVLYIFAVRSLNPRMALASTPFLLYGAIRFAWGRAAARVVFFPCAFLFFMIPVGALEQATNNLQFIITGVVGKLTHMVGISILAVGTTLTATDGSFNFEIAEGCSGIRSLTAMTMLTAVYVHLTQDRLWKKLLIFSCSLGFAIVGNIGRIFSIVLLARYYDPKVAAGVYHEYSGFLFFPIAIVAMIFFSQIINYWTRTGRRTAAPDPLPQPR